METKDLNSIGLAYLEMVEKRNIEAKKNHANALHKNQKALDVHSDEDEDHNDDPTDGDGDIDAADLKKLRQDANKDDKKFDKKKKSSKKDDDQEKFKAYTGDDINDQEGTKVSEAAKYPHMMYDPKTGKGYKAETPADHEKYEKMGYTHDKPEEIDESADLQEGAASELYGGDRVSLSKNEGVDKLNASYNESVNVDDVLALIDQGYTLDQAEAMVAEAACGTVNASRKVSKAGDNDRNMANDQRSIPAKGADTALVRPGTKQQQRDFDKAARMAKSKDKVSLKPMPAALTKKMETEELHGKQHKLDHNKDGKITGPDLEKVRSHGPVQKESVMDRVSNMVEAVRAKNEISELHKKTLGSYAKKAMDDVDTQSRFATEYEKRGMAAKNPGVMDKNFKKANRADDKLRNRKAGINTAIDKMTKEGTAKINELDKKTLGSYINKAADDVEYRAYALGAQEPTELGSVRKGRNRIKGIAKATDRLTKESVQEAAKPTGIHHSTPVTAAQANDEQAAGRWTDKAGRNTMTEKEFVDMHTIHPDVLPEFDGNVAAKKTAEAIKKAPKAVAKTPNIPTSKGDQKIMPDPTPYGGPAVKTESYMDKYAKYIRGDK